MYIRFFNQHVPMPTYSFVNAGTKFWVDIDEHFGVWHAPYSTYLHNKSCFVVRYAANSHGMRDEPRPLQSDMPRAVVLGDSFIEGWGNEAEERLSNRLQSMLDRPVLNFGTSGNFGTVQLWQQYEHFVRSFSHDVVLVGILPANDFKDNSLSVGLEEKQDRYRPYLKGEYPDYELIYFQESIPKRSKRTEILKSIDFTLREWSSLYRVLRYLGSYRIRDFRLKSRWLASYEDEERRPSMYYDFDESDWNVMRYSLEQLIQAAGERPVILFTIPVYADFERFAGSGGETPPLSRNLQELSNSTGAIYVDLLAEMSERIDDVTELFFVCDDHWNPHGNEAAARILLPHVRKAFAAAR